SCAEANSSKNFSRVRAHSHEYREQLHGINGSHRVCYLSCCSTPARMVEYLRSQEMIMPLVGAVAAPHSHLQLFTRPAENEQYKADVQKGRDAMIALRDQGERANADTILVIHDDHFVNFDFRCYPPFALFVGQE